jgi:hypothetical protein
MPHFFGGDLDRVDLGPTQRFDELASAQSGNLGPLTLGNDPLRVPENRCGQAHLAGKLFRGSPELRNGLLGEFDRDGRQRISLSDPGFRKSVPPSSPIGQARANRPVFVWRHRSQAMRLPRMTTRRWMIAVAVAALIMTRVEVRRRQNEFQQLAEYHKKERALIVAGRGRTSGEIEIWLRHDPLQRSWRHSSVWKAAYHSAMREKYERAARYPWLPVEPDPPEPK